MFRQDRTNPSTAVSNWRGRKDTPKGWPSTAVSSWLNGALFVTVEGDGYFFGGWNTGAIRDSIDKLQFSDDSCAAISATTATASDYNCGMSNGTTAGYIAIGTDA